MADANGRVRVPPDDPSYTLRRVWLTEDEEDGYYYGFANSALWPLCHLVYCRPDVRPGALGRLPRGERALRRGRPRGDRRAGPALVFVQDYHFALLPRFLKDGAARTSSSASSGTSRGRNPETFRVCPWAEELLDGMLGNDLLGFHIQYHCNNFLDTVDRTLEARVDRERFAVARGGHATLVRPFPISVDPGAGGRTPRAPLADRAARHAEAARAGPTGRCSSASTGWTTPRASPSGCGPSTGCSSATRNGAGGSTSSRSAPRAATSLPATRRLSDEVDALADAINERYGTERLAAGRLPEASTAGRRTSRALYRCRRRLRRVSSLHDGMNLVAKEFVAARADDRGVLVLSEFTGAARELTDAVLVNPFDVDELADGLHAALTMPAEQQRGGCGRCTRACRTRPCTTGRPASCGRRAEWPLPSD